MASQALSKRGFNREITILQDKDGFVEAYAIMRVEFVENAAVGGVGDTRVPLSLAQAKAMVANL